LVLGMINFSLHLFYDFQWAQTQGLEFLLLLFLAVTYSLVMNIYKGSYFHKKQKASRYALLALFIGLSHTYLSLSPHSPLLINGLLTANSIMLVSGLIWLSTFAAYFTRVLVEKRRDREEN
ncbi:MAG: hypothetical protein JJU01_09980, partial [Alkalibacterium sp.]|nr:hypothetical protein [Alkalibacterium sp.]